VIIVPCVQGEESWFRARMGIPTASNFHRIITPKTCAFSEQSAALAHELLAEWIVDHPITGPETDFMNRGHDLEDAAIEHYELLREVETSAVGFITTDDGMVGCSPDRLVGEDGGVEIKSHPGNPGIHVGFMLGLPLEPKHKPQLQGCLWISERKWWDIISYHDEMSPVIVRIERDEEYIDKLAAAVNEFKDRLLAARLRLDRQYGITERHAQMRASRAPVPDDPGRLGITEEDIDTIWNARQK
jgi:hypothetical protein